MFKGSKLTESDNRRRKLESFASSNKRGAHIEVLQHSTLTRHINFADHKLVILTTSVSKRKWIYVRKKHTPQSMMMLLNCVYCMVSEYLHTPALIQIIDRSFGLENIHFFRVFWFGSNFIIFVLEYFYLFISVESRISPP